MTTIEKIKADIKNQLFVGRILNSKDFDDGLKWCLELIDKYAEQEPCRVKNELNLELNELKPCDDVVSMEAVIEWLKAKDIIKMSTQEETARKELKAFLSVRPKPCEDVVSRQAVLDGIEELKQSPWATDKRGNGFEYLITEALDTVADLCVKQEPSVRPQEQTGHWKRISMDRYTTHAQYWYECDKCGEHNLGNTDFCPYCGCRMVEQRETETWHGIHAQITAPKGTFERIFNEADDDYDI